MANYTGQIPDTAGRRLDWMDSAACVEDSDMFFDATREFDARLVCVVRCPVRVACLTAVKEAERRLGRQARDGVVAGLLHHERWRLDPTVRRDKGDPALLKLDGTEPCGSYVALLGHLWRGELVDPECWSAHVRRERLVRVVQAADTPRPVAPVEPVGPVEPVRPPVRGRTRHERRVHELWSDGLTDLDIARRMAISVPAVRRVRERLGLLVNRQARTAS